MGKLNRLIIGIGAFFALAVLVSGCGALHEKEVNQGGQVDAFDVEVETTGTVSDGDFLPKGKFKFGWASWFFMDKPLKPGTYSHFKAENHCWYSPAQISSSLEMSSYGGMPSGTQADSGSINASVDPLWIIPGLVAAGNGDMKMKMKRTAADGKTVEVEVAITPSCDVSVDSSSSNSTSK